MTSWNRCYYYPHLKALQTGEELQKPRNHTSRIRGSQVSNLRLCLGLAPGRVPSGPNPSDKILPTHRIWTDISLRRYTDGQEAHEKMPNGINHRGNPDENHNKILLPTHSFGDHKEDKHLQVSWRMWRNQSPPTPQCGAAVWTRVWQFLEKFNIQLPTDHTIPIPR